MCESADCIPRIAYHSSKEKSPRQVFEPGDPVPLHPGCGRQPTDRWAIGAVNTAEWDNPDTKYLRGEKGKVPNVFVLYGATRPCLD